MSPKHHLATAVALSLACARPPSAASPSPPDSGAHAKPSSSQTATAAPCDGSFELAVDVYYMPVGRSESFSISRDGRFTLRLVGREGGDASCTGLLDAADSDALMQQIATLELHALPKLVTAPFVRDGIAIAVEGRCGAASIRTTIRNIFPDRSRTLMDLLNATVASAHCQADVRLPTGADLSAWSEATGAAELCGQDCRECNSCSL